MSMIEKCARALCWAQGINPDACTHGSGWANSDGGGMVCHRRAWEDQIGAARAVLSVLMEADEGAIDAGRWPAEDDGPRACFVAMIQHILNEETDGRLPSGRAGGADAPQPAVRSSPDGRSSLTQESES